MRTWLLALLSVALLATPGGVPSVEAKEAYVCWYEWVVDQDLNERRQVLRCRINGEVVQDFPGGPPVVTVPDVGIDAAGVCWFRRTGLWSGWQLVELYANNDGLFWWSPSGDPNGPWIGDGIYRACTSEPVPTPPPIVQVWEVIERYDFVEPDPTVAPNAVGYTGLETYLGVDPPDFFSTTIPSPVGGGNIDIEISVVTVEIDWGDGILVSFGEDQWGLLGGYPDGDVFHLYETKDFYDLSVTYNWFVRWRANGGPWNTIIINPTAWTATYEVDEIVSRRTG